MKKLSALCLALLLTACGGGGTGGEAPFVPGPTPPPTTPTPPPSVMDAFFTRVLAIIGVATDDAEPIAVEDIVLTTPEDTEPEPVT
ncbi:hypothetical protein KY495_12885 [Massilia sp. PAMC28688]|uniref:hypothetical protein n=1 Tax=Massilia sp. PAMC28688 TaxID=2861283 RepID=UPI001C62B7D7|nr:hypothetical protein [Massilia sp. PAMC28688]QYF91699.1 hypothetical protein KY495_12885 [Massilia sp. PAMC28688]